MERPPEVPAPRDPLEHARELAQRVLILDGHIDAPFRLEKSRDKLGHVTEDLSERTPTGNFDYVRAREGGLDVPFMSIYVPSKYEHHGAKAFANKLIGLVEDLVAQHPDKFALARSPDEARRNAAQDKLSLAMGMENGAPLEHRLENVRYFHERGIRYITLTHFRDNHICDSSSDDHHTHHGLSPFGKRVVHEMNRVGIMIDVSHVSDDSFWQVLAESKTPVIASHSSCRHFTPGWSRNMSDDMIAALGRAGGVIQINFGSGFLSRPEGADAGAPARASVERVADHIDHVVKLAGIEHVGLGSDFDGVGDTLPTGLGDVSMYPNLIRVLLERGYDEAQIEAICSGNVLRVWQAAQDFAEQAHAGL